MSWQLVFDATLGLTVLVALFIATRPSFADVSESITIHAAEVPVFEVATDFHRWRPWDGWDPQVEYKYVGHASRLGAGLSWESTGHAGSGRLTVTDVTGTSRVSYLLEELTPTLSLQVTHLALASKDGATTVTWSFTAQRSYLQKVAAFFGVVETSAQKKLHTGLAALKARVEAEAKSPDARPPSLIACSFCGKTQREVRKLISGPSVAICDECVLLCNDVIAEEIEKERLAEPR